MTRDLDPQAGSALQFGTEGFYASLASGARRSLASTVCIMVFSGVGVWPLADPDTVVVGASGVIFGYLGLCWPAG